MMKDIYSVFLKMTFILLTDLIIVKKRMEAARLPIPLQGNVTTAITILSGTKVGFMMM